MSQALAIQALKKLLGRAERARNKGEERAVTLPFTQASFEAYFALPTPHAGLHEILAWPHAIDPGGFRVAACLARAAGRMGRRLSLWQMIPTRFAPDLAYRRLSRTDISEMRRICGNFGWVPEAAALEISGLGFEQEALPALLPIVKG